MDMRSREQYLESVRQEYRQASRKKKTKLLNEARKRTRLNRKVLIRKLAHPAKIRPASKRRPRGATYGPEVLTALVKIWELFDYPCGQRLVPAIRGELERLRKLKEIYRKVRVRVEHTQARQVSIGERRRPDPKGRPGYLRVDTVHQGHHDGQPGLYHINAVDTVTQWQIVGCVETLSERHLKPVLEAMLHQFLFASWGFTATTVPSS